MILLDFCILIKLFKSNQVVGKAKRGLQFILHIHDVVRALLTTTI
jgi:hypothetical protein